MPCASSEEERRDIGARADINEWLLSRVSGSASEVLVLIPLVRDRLVFECLFKFHALVDQGDARRH